MARAAVQVGPSPVGGRRAADVPRRIRVLAGAAAAALAVFFGAVWMVAGEARDGLRVIGHDAGPQVVATAGLYLALSDMDGQVALALLAGEERGERRRAALARYERRRGEAGQALLRASALAGGDAAERRTVQAVLDGLGRYERLAARALLLDEQAPPGDAPAAALAVYRDAADLMREELLPQAYNLTLESGTIVRRTHDETRVALFLGRWGMAAAAVAALGCLVALQVFLARRFRRLIGPALLLATVVTAVYACAGIAALGGAAETLTRAKRDGFDAVLSLARARAMSNDMHGDQTRYLLDRERADTYEHTYLNAAQSVYYVEAGNLRQYHQGVARATPAERRPGFLGDVLARRPSGAEPLAAYGGFQRADARMRALAEERRGEAVALRLGALEKAYDDYDARLADAARRYVAVFEGAVREGEDALRDVTFPLPIAVIAAAALLVGGVGPRLGEYR
ncbi:hypothetical protein [Bailinhaonella thermotolerans]|uniref:Uncharacterized protein n=1 Tax=Bailinhaonella thermotolerans TaxID=1070861 RepID=A0A3A4ATC6_9ACTN|nr:hypothetical protein [Bailinhaonella thermotolerans]RJL32623.1 hypothetical protein D5H75_14010 [Bailinhaonella thermotolerans]